MVLYVYVIQGQFEACENGEEYLKAGEQAQNDLRTYDASSSFCRRYVLVLEELLDEGRKFIRHRRPNAKSRTAVTSHPCQDTSLNTAGHENQSAMEIVPFTEQVPLDIVNSFSKDLDGSWVPTAEFPGVQQQSETQRQTDSSTDNTVNLPAETEDFTNWGEFDSLALIGYGDLDLTFPVRADEPLGPAQFSGLLDT